ncbi:FAD-dependent oxidoreductase [Demequina sp. TTPB684]|uniref:NAD(P)/FAD-dependent oxidoreductase n=1 Tax=unclassified Demequina TaxID=2620311 RepID=UPI001CF4973E|nr:MULTISPECIES: FAD-dependent oxidoreductase [unclassified Demequina]MCB2413015.1 FAD-dependent oxidoreductase [Demequina sp. TTPB684]UPU87084.1 FAD-dependent oxidoreductase [Demequina sp. TMPB413]
MARVVVLGAGVSGHTAALYLKKRLGKAHDVVVVSPNSQYNWIPSNIWVGVGKMTTDDVVFPLAPIYAKKGIEFVQAKAVALWPEGDADADQPAVEVEHTSSDRAGETEKIRYDYVINATGPKLNFGATPGLGPDEGHTVSVCTPSHATEANIKLGDVIEAAKAGKTQRVVIGVGHGTCTCEGAAFEYTFNVEHELRAAGVRDKVELTYLTNENELGDFGVGGMQFEQNGFRTTSQLWTESLYRERGVKAISGAAVTSIDEGVIHYDQLDGSHNDLEFDFAMLLPPFKGADWKAYNKSGEDITDTVFAPSGFMKVDADYSKKSYDDWSAKDWPRTYQNPTYKNCFAVGIAFAPPHQISKPRATPDGLAVAPSPPRTGMPSGTMGKVVAFSVADMILKGAKEPTHSASMAEMAAACVASAGTGMRTGTAAAMTMSPVAPDWEKYPETGRNLKETFGEIGLAGHWVKRLLHTLFIYKAKVKPGWTWIPE